MEHRSDASGPKGRLPNASKPARRIPAILVATIVLTALSPLLTNAGGESPEQGESGWQVKVIEPEVVSIVPHDPTAFTQGLEIHDGKFYESTGLYGESSVRIVNMSTGEIEVQHNLSDEYFGEGLTIWNGSVIQLTWRENTGFIYDVETLEPIGEFTYEGEGWGICQSGVSGIWLSDGTSTLSRSSNDELSFSASTEVLVGGVSSDRWNELECESLDGDVLANRWYDDSIYMISTSTGYVCQSADFSEIRQQFENENSGVLNGIAYDKTNETWWVTGKNWSNYYEVNIQFELLDSSCFASFDDPDCLECGDNPMLQNIALFSSFILIVVLILRGLSERQTEKPPLLREEE